MKTVVFTGGGTGGHIYPGLGIADELRKIAADTGTEIQIIWIGSSAGMDKDIVEKSGSADRFIGIPCGKLRRFFSLRNFTDLFRIFAGFIKAFFVLVRLKPCAVFSKGGFVSVPPCYAAKLLSIPVYTHECDFSPGLATRLNSKCASKILLSFEKTAEYFSSEMKSKLIVTGNPVRPVFYSAEKKRGIEFLEKSSGRKIPADKQILLVLGGSLGAMQINTLVSENLEWLCRNFTVVHQTGAKWASENSGKETFSSESYLPYSFIYSEMPDVMAAADIVLSRAGSNFLWECAVTKKPLVLIPLSGSGTRGDQVENAAFFESEGAALVLGGRKTDGSETAAADSENLKSVLEKLKDEEIRRKMSENVFRLTQDKKPAECIAKLIYDEVIKTK